MINAYIKMWVNFSDFFGRSRRRDYWLAMLADIIVAILLAFIVPVVAWVYQIASLVPSLALGVRRLHDIGRTGWWLLIGGHRGLVWALSARQCDAITATF